MRTWGVDGDGCWRAVVGVLVVLVKQQRCEHLRQRWVQAMLYSMRQR